MKYCFALDLVDDPDLISEYEIHHQNVWPEIIESIAATGITVLEIYRVSNRLFMIMETDESFSLDDKKAMDDSNPKVQEWEALMWKYQQPLPVAKPGEKWVLMHKFFELNT